MSKRKAKNIDLIQEKQSTVDAIYHDKLGLLQFLETINDRYNSLSPTLVTSSEDAGKWFSSMPIESLCDLDSSIRTNKLNVLKERADLRKSAIKTCEELIRLDSELRVAKIDVLAEKINATLKM